MQVLYVSYDPNKPRQLAYLITEGYLSDDGARILYCPSWTNPYIKFNHADAAVWGTQGGWQSGGWSSFNSLGIGGIYTAYEYRGTFTDDGRLWVSTAAPRSASLRKESADHAILADRWLHKKPDNWARGSEWKYHENVAWTKYFDRH